MPEGRQGAVHELANCFEPVRASFNGALLEFCRRLMDLALGFPSPAPYSAHNRLFFSLGLNKECAAVLAGLQLQVEVLVGCFEKRTS